MSPSLSLCVYVSMYCMYHMRNSINRENLTISVCCTMLLEKYQLTKSLLTTRYKTLKMFHKTLKIKHILRAQQAHEKLKCNSKLLLYTYCNPKDDGRDLTNIFFLCLCIEFFVTFCFCFSFNSKKKEMTSFHCF